jgi:excisionase family DNA binding protein
MTDIADENRLLDLGEAKGFSRSKLYSLMTSGTLPFVKLGKSRRVRMAALLTLIEEHACQGGSEPR